MLQTPHLVKILAIIVYYVVNSMEYDVSSRGGFLDFLLFGPCKCKCGLPNRQGRPSAGEYLNNYEFPWLALIQMAGGVTASGTLINNKYIITTASLLKGMTPFDIKVTLGQIDRCIPDISSLNVSVESIYRHKEFNPGTGMHDIALLKLSSPVSFEKRISPICLSTPQSSYVGQVATFVGWPLPIDERTQTRCRPRKLGLPVLDHQNCQKSALDSELITGDKRCAGVIGTTSVICKSDEGSPVMYRSYAGVYELIGIVSEQNECSDKSGTALYTTINEHLSWITENTKDACYCLKTNY
ncbi:hypothetical protein RI129_001411 [Pyrocoelia pectoralis]|uniref:Peptidase S1 domain-containing protein n=1 Tax=Pyrocoelia pectoralis TaxID=417401 RepID=A0AAN7VKP7_9COLE